MTSKEFEILTNIIGGVESGGQVYGQRNYAAYAPPYNASPDEHTCTLGWAQNYGYNANKLLNKIYAMDKSAVPSDIVPMLKVDWVATRWNPTASQKQSLIKAITTTAGKKCQDEMFKETTEPVIKKAESLGITDVGCQVMYVEIAHLGGESAAQRIFNKTSKPYTVDGIFNTLMLDQKDTSNNNQVGDKVYQSRHECCVKWIKQYLNTTQTTTTAKGSDAVATYEISGGNMISNSGSDENGNYRSGKAGDQNGKEWQIRTWYNRPWDCVLRHPDEKVRQKISELSIKAAYNDKIGYDQNERYTYWDLLKMVNYDPSKITTACEADCSAGVIANTKAVGYLLGITALKNIWATYTGNMRQSFKEAGFQVLTDKKYLTAPDYLLPGDILLNDVHHVCTFVSTGSKAKSSTSTASTTTTTTAKEKPWKAKLTRNAKVRTWAGNEYKEVSFSPLKKNTEIEVQYSLKANDGSTWYYFKYGTDKFAFIDAEEVVKVTTTTVTEKPTTEKKKTQYRVQAGVYAVKANAKSTKATLKKAGYEPIIVTVDKQYIVQLGMFDNPQNAQNLKMQLNADGFDAAVIAIKV